MSKSSEKKMSQSRGQGISKLREKYGRPDTEFFNSGVFILNDLWGGGFPTGKIIELHSDAGYGKSTIALQIARALIEEHGKKVGFMDVENALDPALKESMGISKHEFDDQSAPSFLHLSPNKFSEIEETTIFMLENKYDLIIFDSLTNAVPDRRKDGSINDIAPGIKSQMQGLYLEQFKADFARNSSTLLIINQMRFKISFINTTLQPAGGQALHYNTDIRTGMKKVADIKDGDNLIGYKLDFITIKNKITAPFRSVSANFYFGKGINNEESLADSLIEKGVVIQSGAYFKVPGVEKNFQGKVSFYDWVYKNIDKAKEMLGDSTSIVNQQDVEEVLE